MIAQGKAESPGRRSAALGGARVHDRSPERAEQTVNPVFRPFRAGYSTDTATQGDGNARKTRVALPWATMFEPLRGGRTIVPQMQTAAEVCHAGMRQSGDVQLEPIPKPRDGQEWPSYGEVLG